MTEQQVTLTVRLPVQVTLTATWNAEEQIAEIENVLHVSVDKPAISALYAQLDDDALVSLDNQVDSEAS